MMLSLVVDSFASLPVGQPLLTEFGVGMTVAAAGLAVYYAADWWQNR